MNNGFLILKLVLTGDKIKPAILDFKSGLNVISGPTDTGKSFIFDCINYMLGGQSLERRPPESTNYDKVFLEIISNDINYTLERAINGGQFNLYETKFENINLTKPKVLLTKLDKDNENNISTFFLNLCNLNKKEIRKNAKGVKVSLSFRDICHLTLIAETEIIKLDSPIFAKGGFQKTKELNVVKFLVTGQDDNAIIAEPDEKLIQYKKGKVELLEELILSFKEKSVENLENDDQLNLIDKSIANLKNEQSDLLNKFSIYDINRKTLSKNIFNSQNLFEQIAETLSRSNLLKEHYISDKKRLNSTIEAGFLLSEGIDNLNSCPYCNGDIKSTFSNSQISETIFSCEKENEKIDFLLSEVNESILQLNNEGEELNKKIENERYALREIEELINSNINESLNNIGEKINQLYNKRDELLKTKFTQESITKFIEFKDGITNTIQSKADNLFKDLSNSNMFPINEKIYSILKECNYPELETISFSENNSDFVIGSKNRNLSGKGIRAITYATFVIALSEFLTTRNFKMGVPVLDSPLVTYKNPKSNGEGISEDLAMNFYRYCAKQENCPQIIILENEEPPNDILNKINHIVFTGNENFGRYGFIPR